MTTQQPPKQLTLREQQDRRLSNLAIELGIASVETLIEEFGFTQERADEFLQKMKARALKNRQKR